MAKTSQANPDEDGSIVSSRAERYKLWAEKKSSIALPPLHMLESVGETIAAPTTINDEVTSTLSAASVACSWAKLSNPPMEYARMKELAKYSPLNSLTPIRVLAGMKNSRPIEFLQ